MNTIKFRAWDGKEMFNVDVLAISECMWSCPDYGKRGVSLSYQPSIIVIQYVGLKDKNDKEIYEGDIVTCEGTIYICKWNEHRCEFAWYTLDGQYIYPIGDCRTHLEIIGNIYQHSELLTLNQFPEPINNA